MCLSKRLAIESRLFDPTEVVINKALFNIILSSSSWSVCNADMFSIKFSDVELSL